MQKLLTWILFLFVIEAEAIAMRARNDNPETHLELWHDLRRRGWL